MGWGRHSYGVSTTLWSCAACHGSTVAKVSSSIKATVVALCYFNTNVALQLLRRVVDFGLKSPLVLADRVNSFYACCLCKWSVGGWIYLVSDCCVVLADRVNSTGFLAFTIELSETDGSFGRWLNWRLSPPC
jgi:hypothetical protein